MRDIRQAQHSNEKDHLQSIPLHRLLRPSTTHHDLLLCQDLLDHYNTQQEQAKVSRVDAKWKRQQRQPATNNRNRR